MRAVGLALLLGCMTASAAHAEATEEQVDQGEPLAARPSDNLYALSGFWMVDEWKPGLAPRGMIAFTGEFEEQRAALEALKASGGAPQGNEPLCIPNGPPMMMKMAFDIYVRGQRMIIATDRVNRFIDVDREHSPIEDLFTSYGGESVAHWEGDTLVVDTIGLEKTNEIEWGVPNSGALHVIERFTLVTPENLRIDQWVMDPGAMSEPWTITRTYTRKAEPEAFESAYCVAANDPTRDPITGEQGFDLNPPDEGYIPPE